MPNDSNAKDVMGPVLGYTSCSKDSRWQVHVRHVVGKELQFLEAQNVVLAPEMAWYGSAKLSAFIFPEVLRTACG